MNRRDVLRGLAGAAVLGLGTGVYGVVIEGGLMLNITRYALTPPGWTPGLKLRAVVLSDPHVVEPFMPLSRWQKIIDTANALEPDIFFLLGDYMTSMKFRLATVPIKDTARTAARLRAPLGVFSINGNHDWWADRPAMQAMKGPPTAQKAFEDAGIPVLANRAVRLLKDGKAFWVTGTDSIVAFWRGVHEGLIGADDLEGALAQVTDDAPIIHLAHEPDLFVDVPPRVSLTLSGHTHGGQVRIAGFAPMVPSQYGRRFLYGHIVEEGRNLIVSGGLGCSGVPLRFGSPPEINLLELG